VGKGVGDGDVHIGGRRKEHSGVSDGRVAALGRAVTPLEASLSPGAAAGGWPAQPVLVVGSLDIYMVGRDRCRLYSNPSR